MICEVTRKGFEQLRRCHWFSSAVLTWLPAFELGRASTTLIIRTAKSTNLSSRSVGLSIRLPPSTINNLQSVILNQTWASISQKTGLPDCCHSSYESETLPLGPRRCIFPRESVRFGRYADLTEFEFTSIWPLSPGGRGRYDIET